MTGFLLLDCLSSTMTLPDLPSEISCYHHDSCNAVTCCMEIAKFNNRTIDVSFKFDECANFLSLTIERISKTIYLHNFAYGLLFNWLMNKRDNFFFSFFFFLQIFKNIILILLNLPLLCNYDIYKHWPFILLLQDYSIHFQ